MDQEKASTLKNKEKRKRHKTSHPKSWLFSKLTGCPYQGIRRVFVVISLRTRGKFSKGVMNLHAKTHLPRNISRRSLHGLLLVTTSRGSKVSDIDIVICLQLLQAGQDLLLDKFLAVG